MEENREYIDELFKNKLSNQDFEAPQDFIFDIQNRIKKKRESKRRILFYFLVFGSLSIFTMGYFFFKAVSDQNNSISIQKIEKKKTEKSTTKVIQKIGFKTTSSNGTKINVNSNKAKQSNGSLETKIHGHTTILKQGNQFKDKEKISIKNYNQNFKLQIQTIDTETISNPNSDSNRTDSNDTDTKNQGQPIAVSSSTDTITEFNHSAKSDSILDASKRKNEVQLTNQEKTNSPSKNRYEIQAFFGPKVNLMDRNSAMKMNSLGIFKSPSVSFSFGLNSQITRKNFVFGTGIQYAEWKENFKWTQLNKFLIDSFQLNLHLAIPNPLDTTGTNFYPININNVNYVFKDSLVNYKLKNSIRYIQIPFYFGYTFQFRSIELLPKFGFNLMFSKANQTIEIPTYHVNEVNGFSEPLMPFKSFQTNQFLMSYQLEVEIKKRINQWYVYVSPYCGNMINSMIQSSNKKSSSYFGSNFGIGISF